MAAQVILVEASPRRASDGVVETVRLAGGGAAEKYFYGGYHWQAGIAALPAFATALSFDGTDLGTGGVPRATELSWAPAGAARQAAVSAYFWKDAAVTVRIGPENSAGTLPPIVLAGVVLDVSVSGGVLKIVLADPAVELKKPMPAGRFLGTGGAEGPAEWEGLLRQRIWGRVWNQPGQPIDKANNIYCFADPQRQIQSIDAVRDKGANAAALTTQAWAGSVAATFTALQAAVPPAGGGVKCPSIGCVKWWTQPAGDLCADLKGEIGLGYVETTASIAERLVQSLSGAPAFAAGQVAAANALRGAPIGWVVKDENAQVAAMLDELFGNVSLLWALDNAGAIVVREWAWGASAAAATSVEVARNKTYFPLGTRKIGYQRNELPMSRGDIAGIVLMGDVVNTAGAPLSAPDLGVEDNADVTLLVTGTRSLSIAYDYTGTVKTGELPKDVPFKLVNSSSTDVTTLAAWTATTKSGSATYTIGAATGVLNVTAVATDAVIEVKATYNGKERVGTATLIRALDAAPPSGAGGGTSDSASLSVVGQTSSYGSAAGRVLSAKAGASGQVDLSGVVDFYKVTNGTVGAYGKWQWRAVGGSFADVASEVASTSSAYRTSAPEPENTPGSLYVSQSKTGLTTGTTYEFQLLVRSAGGNIDLGGSEAAVGS